ncbi:MAG: biotin transporter BioY [Pseudomonadota bacterium]
MTIAEPNALVSGLFPVDRRAGLLRDVALIAFASCLLAIASQIKVPIGPVPINLTSMVVLLIGAVYGWRLGAATIFAYWAQGIALGGLMPWFANGSGLAYFLAAPSAGFLWGYMAMVVVVGFFADTLRWRQSAGLLFAAMLIGQVALYAIGLAHAYVLVMPVVDWMSNSADMFRIYLTPFVVGDLMKTALAALITIQGWQVVDKRLKP